MNFTQFYAQLFGIYLIIISVSMLINAKMFRGYVTQEIINTPLILFAGVISLLFGLIVVLTHPIWTGWPVIITIIGVLAILKGIVRLFFTNWYINSAPKFVFGKGYYVSGIILLLLGVALTYFGFI